VSVAPILPLDAAVALEGIGWGRPLTLMPGDSVLMSVRMDIDNPATLQATILSAYCDAMS